MTAAASSDAAEALVKQGCVRLEQIFDPALIDALRSEYQRQYPDLAADGMKVGERRLQLAVQLTGPFLSPEVYANPALLALATAALGEDVLIDSIAVVTALPGAAPQHLHKDHDDLFLEVPLARSLVGPYAITVAIPLVDLTPATGTTKLFLGSHRGKLDEDAVDLPYDPRGGCYVMDYRLWHRGTDNLSAAERPIIYLVYARPWFIDIINYGNNRRINLAAADLASIPAEHRPLFRRLAAFGAFDVPQNRLFEA
ncbi:phytanoyl-CoA dioxygenase family protein [Sphingomonas sp.]|uniref:phytanoyl-CoA dioxygenase family protein n=1 Tax=Sphingomonas sp. TaxID=28214 RepID=UPI00286E69AD|nr:phytanoyl-CoA dioxygenase family protein [Sphingomonas sp.]